MGPVGGAAWGLVRDALMYLGTRQGGLWLAEVAPEGGVKYQAAAQAVTRCGQALAVIAERKRLRIGAQAQVVNPLDATHCFAPARHTSSVARRAQPPTKRAPRQTLRKRGCLLVSPK